MLRHNRTSSNKYDSTVSIEKSPSSDVNDGIDIDINTQSKEKENGSMKTIFVHLGRFKMKVMGQFVKASKRFILFSFLLLLALLSQIDLINYRVKSLSKDVDVYVYVGEEMKTAFQDTPVVMAGKRPISGINDIGPEDREVNLDAQCKDDTTRAVLKTWKNNSRLVCEITPEAASVTRNSTLKVVQYRLQPWEYHPDVIRYSNVEAPSMTGLLMGTDCERVNTKIQEENGSMTTPVWATSAIPMKDNESVILVNATTIRVKPFDSTNSYERFHAYLNVAMIMSMFEIKDPQIILLKDGNQIPSGDKEMWESFSNLDPLYLGENGIYEQNSTSTSRYLFRDLIDASSSGTSMLVTRTSRGSSFRGRGTDHHCKSSLFQDIIRWMILNFDLEHNKSTSNVTQVVWSSRSKYKRLGQWYEPSRIINNEEGLIKELGDSLGDKYNITTIDFGKISTYESIKAAASSDIIMGVHGAGLVWASFLPRHGGLVEIFGGNRGSSNRHYHNIASLADIHYRSTNMNAGNSGKFFWGKRDVHDLDAIVRSINMESEPGNR